MPAIETAAMPKVAGMARSYAARLSCFVVPACGDGGYPESSSSCVIRDFSGYRIKSGMTDWLLFFQPNVSSTNQQLRKLNYILTSQPVNRSTNQSRKKE